MPQSSVTNSYVTASGVVYTVTTRSYWLSLAPSNISYSYDVVITSPDGEVILDKENINRGINIAGIIQLAASGDVILGSDNSSVLLQGLSLGTYVSVPGSTGDFIIGAGIGTINTYYIGGDTSIEGLANIATGSIINIVGGTATLSGNNGSSLAGALSGSSINIDYGGTFDTGVSLASVLAGSTITFGDNGGTLVLNGGNTFINLLGNGSLNATSFNNYNPNKDIIKLENTLGEITRYTISNGGLLGTIDSQKIITLYNVNGEKVAEYAVSPAAEITLNNGTYTLNDSGDSGPLQITYDSGNIYIGGSVVCFLAGSMVQSPNGLVAVEDIMVGDLVMTFDQETQNNIARPVVWVGKSHLTVCPDLPNDLSGYPVRILKGAIAEGVPYKDMLITAEHCLFLNGQFIPARMLVNNSSIFYDKTIVSYDFYHIETEQHSVLIVDGMLTESYLNTDNHLIFKQDQRKIKSWDHDACAPLSVLRQVVEPLYMELKQRAKEHLNIIDALDDDCNNIIIDDYGICVTAPDHGYLPCVRSTRDYAIFRLPSNVDEVVIHSYFTRPCDSMGPYVDDRRNLGVLIGEITILDKNHIQIIDDHLTQPNLSGWYGVEQGRYRWTNGRATLNLRPYKKDTIAILKIPIVAGGPYILRSDQKVIKAVS